MDGDTVAQDRDVLRSNYDQLSAKLELATDPAQIVVLESCLAELGKELGVLTAH